MLEADALPPSDRSHRVLCTSACPIIRVSSGLVGEPWKAAGPLPVVAGLMTNLYDIIPGISGIRSIHIMPFRALVVGLTNAG